MEDLPMTDAQNAPADTSAKQASDQKAALTPPTSEDMDRGKRDGSSSELSELELDDEEDIGDIEPDHYWDGGKIPVFKPTMDQFRSFKKFIDKIDKYGMKSGIVKVVPPQEWRDSLPNLDEAVKKIKVKNPITQDFSGSRGQYTQQNVEKQRSYNLPEWKALTNQWEHKPPAKRGERRGDVAPPPRTRATRNREASVATPPAEPGVKRTRGRPRKNPPKEVKKEVDEDSSVVETVEHMDTQPTVPPTPSSPPDEATAVNKKVATLQKAAGEGSPKPRGRQPKSISSRRKHNRGETTDDVDEQAFDDFDYHLEGVEEFTPERCAELEQNYWKTINFGQPMYGADMPGSLFDENTTSWNVAKLENLLDVLGTKVPGVNTAYLYLGMWKATFAWHLEDVDLYSINYIHFGAPKQWYSISQEDARKFENAMKSVWPNDAKNCSQFLRHKTYLISPQRLESEFGIKVNKLVHYEGEFVLTYPYGYHSGYNIGYNCAESVNFATEAWLEYGRIAKKCDCESDSVWVDVAEIERKLRGEPTPEYIEETDEEDDEDDTEETGHDLPSPPSSVKGKPKASSRKRKRETGDKATEGKVKRVKLRLRVPKEEPCILCPNDVTFDVLLPTDNGQKAHRLCALYTPETYIIEENGVERVCNVANIDKARLELKCNYCRSKRGACFQCAAKKCIRAFHATCAAAAGVQIDEGPVPTFDEDGTEYYCDGFDLRCRFHRPRRPKFTDVDSLENNKLIPDFAKSLEPKQVVQAQYLSGEIFAGTVVENKPEELSVIIDVLPTSFERVEVEWKYLLVLDPAQSLRPKPSTNAVPLPEHLNQASSTLNAKNQKDGPPEMDTPFCDANTEFKWAEFHTATAAEVKNPFQAKVGITVPQQLWHYLGKTSTEAKAQYTDDLRRQQHNPKSNFLDTVKPPPRPVQAYQSRAIGPAYSSGVNINALNGAMAAQRQSMQPHYGQKPYEYKPRSGPAYTAQQTAYPPYPYNGQPAGRSGPFPYSPVPPYPYSPVSYQDARKSSAGSANSPPTQTPHHPPNYVPPYHQTTSHSPYASVYGDPRAGQPVHYPNYHRPSFSSPYHHPLRPVAASPPAAGSAISATSMSPSAHSSSPAIHSDSISSTSSKSPDLEYLQFLQRFPYLLNSYLRRPKVYESPYPGTSGFSEAYNPRRIMAEKQAQRQAAAYPQPQGGYPGANGYGGSQQPHGYQQPYAPGHPPAQNTRPGLTFQSAQDFRADVNRTQASQMSNMPKFEMLIKQLSQANETAARRFAARTQAHQAQQHQQQDAHAPLPPSHQAQVQYHHAPPPPSSTALAAAAAAVAAASHHHHHHQSGQHERQVAPPPLPIATTTTTTPLGGYTGPSNTRGYRPGYGYDSGAFGPDTQTKVPSPFNQPVTPHARPPRPRPAPALAPASATPAAPVVATPVTPTQQSSSSSTTAAAGHGPAAGEGRRTPQRPAVSPLSDAGDDRMVAGETTTTMMMTPLPPPATSTSTTSAATAAAAAAAAAVEAATLAQAQTEQQQQQKSGAEEQQQQQQTAAIPPPAAADASDGGGRETWRYT